MRKLMLLVCMALLSAAMYLWAANPWEEKPWGEWSQAEVNKVLQDSPWARRTGEVPTLIAPGLGATGGVSVG